MTGDAYRSTDFSLALDARIRAYKASVAADDKYASFDTQLLKQAQYIRSDTADKTVFFEFQVTEPMCNKDGVLHGGAASTLFDNLSSTSLFTIGRPGFWDSLGVSRSLCVWFHNPLPLGTKVQLVCTVIQAGRRMATVRAVMKTSDGKVCASCVHEKFQVIATSKF